jgi:hypothetical protein
MLFEAEVDEDFAIVLENLSYLDVDPAFLVWGHNSISREQNTLAKEMAEEVLE